MPPRIVDQRIGRGTSSTRRCRRRSTAFYGQALEQEQIACSPARDVDVKEFNDGEQLVFTAEVDVRPEVTLPELDSIEIAVDDVTVTDEDVDEQIEGLRDRFATLQPVERPARTATT